MPLVKTLDSESNDHATINGNCNDVGIDKNYDKGHHKYENSCIVDAHQRGRSYRRWYTKPALITISVKNSPMLE